VFTINFVGEILIIILHFLMFTIPYYGQVLGEILISFMPMNICFIESFE